MLFMAGSEEHVSLYEKRVRGNFGRTQAASDRALPAFEKWRPQCGGTHACTGKEIPPDERDLGSMSSSHYN